MAVTRAKKDEQVEKLSKDLKNVKLIVATYTKLTSRRTTSCARRCEQRARSIGGEEHAGRARCQGHQG